MMQEKDRNNSSEDLSPDLTPEQKAKVLRFRERIYPVFSQEEKDHISGEMKTWFEEGCCQPKMEPSLLGLDWSSFVTRKFPEHDRQISFLNPPEFVSYGFSALDAYATAMLAANFSSESHGLLTFTCKLKQFDSECKLSLDFMTTSEQGRIDSGRIMLELLSSFPVLLHAKNIEGGAVLFLEGDGCPMKCNYPGRMISSVSPFLRNRPVDLWPQAILVLMPTVELRKRALDILSFLRSADPIEENPN
ncbi:MAG: hypothetical protein ABSD59_23675 [Terracidiphilus sp.]